jgi:UDP-perosamine 4-acetyltransferase
MTADGAPVILLGSGGHAKVIIDMLLDRNDCRLAGCVTFETDAADLLGLPILGNDDALGGLFASGLRHVFVAIGDNRVRAERLKHVRGLGFTIVNAISRHATVSSRATLGQGVAIMPGAVINVDTIVEDGAIINTGATVDHDCRIGACAHIAPGTHLAGNVTIGEGTFLGVGTSVIPRRAIGAWSTIGAGSAIVRDIGDRVTAVGVPARVIKRHAGEGRS